MHLTQFDTISKAVASAFLLVSLAACAGSGAPTPPGMIGGSPQSIMDTQPPASDLADADTGAVPPIGDGTAQTDVNGLPPASTIANAGTTPAPSVQYKAPESSAVLTFEPMVGAPKSVARELSTSLGLRVAQHALPVVARTDSKVTHRIKGYFSASQSGSNCVVSYVWDIFDASGKRVNRVTGSQSTAMVSDDPWDSVKGPILDQVAVDTAAKLKSWHASI